MEWETGEISWEPLMTADKKGVYDTDPVTVAIFARKHDLLETVGWRLRAVLEIHSCASGQKGQRKLNNRHY